MGQILHRVRWLSLKGRRTSCTPAYFERINMLIMETRFFHDFPASMLKDMPDDCPDVCVRGRCRSGNTHRLDGTVIPILLLNVTQTPTPTPTVLYCSRSLLHCEKWNTRMAVTFELESIKEPFGGSFPVPPFTFICVSSVSFNVESFSLCKAIAIATATTATATVKEEKKTSAFDVDALTVLFRSHWSDFRVWACPSCPVPSRHEQLNYVYR